MVTNFRFIGVFNLMCLLFVIYILQLHVNIKLKKPNVEKMIVNYTW